MNGSLDFKACELATLLGVPPSIFEHSAMVPQLGGFLSPPPQGQQSPQPDPHAPLGAAAASRAADEHMPTWGAPSLQPLQGRQVPATPAACHGSSNADSGALNGSLLFEDEPPSSSDDMPDQQPVGCEPGYSALADIGYSGPGTFQQQMAVSSTVLPASLPLLNKQGMPDHNGFVEPGQVRGLLFTVSTAPGSPQLGLMSSQAGQGVARYGFEQHSHPADMLQPQQFPSSSMRQDVQAPEQMALAFLAPWVTKERLSLSQIERVRSRELAPTNSFIE